MTDVLDANDTRRCGLLFVVVAVSSRFFLGTVANAAAVAVLVVARQEHDKADCFAIDDAVKASPWLGTVMTVVGEARIRSVRIIVLVQAGSK